VTRLKQTIIIHSIAARQYVDIERNKWLFFFEKNQ